MKTETTTPSGCSVAAGSASELLKQWNCAIKDPTETLRFQQGDMSLIVWFLDKAIKQLAAIESNQPNTQGLVTPGTGLSAENAPASRRHQ